MYAISVKAKDNIPVFVARTLTYIGISIVLWEKGKAVR